MPVDCDLASLSKWLLDFSDCWDFRGKQARAFDNKVGEGARWLLSDDDLTEVQQALTLKAVSALGLRDNEHPVIEHFDYVWVLGGARLSCLLRTRLAIKTIESFEHKPKAVILLASMRPISDSERDATDVYAQNAETEFDLFVAAAKSEFGVGLEYNEERHDDTENANNSWIIRKYHTTAYDVFIVAAPSSDPHKRRANSSDTYEFFFNRFHVEKGSAILLATSQIYVPYQHMEALRTIAFPHGIYLDTIGFPVEWSGSLQGLNNPSNYLQEIRSTIQSIARFVDTYGA
jgi:hypothetical protein